MRAALVLLVCAVLSACGPGLRWVKPGASDSDLAKDTRECDYEATKATAGIRNAFEAGWAKADISEKCLEVRGWKRQR